jgi:hypothetical protein
VIFLNLSECQQIAVNACPKNGFDRWIVAGLYKDITEINERHFGGKLPPVIIKTGQEYFQHSFGHCRKIYDVPGCAYEIFIDSGLILENILSDKFCYARWTLLHECIHLLGLSAFSTHEIDKYIHGNWFKTQSNKIGQYYGWPKVHSHYRKHRKNKPRVPDCQSWPHCVESAEYQKEFQDLQARVRAKFLSQKPADLPQDDATTIKMRGLAGLKTIEQYIMDSAPGVQEISALSHISKLVQLVCPAFKMQYIRGAA